MKKIIASLALAVSLFSTTLRAENLVVLAGRTVGVRSVLEGREDAVLTRVAQGHAEYMARVCRQGHQGFDGRFQYLRNYGKVSEIVAESWEWQDQNESAFDFFKSWRQSPGHWSVANGTCRYYGYGMAKGRNGIWYGCGITAQ